MSTAITKKRKKVNFMIDIDILEQLEKFIPAGKRSDFINEKMQEIVRDYSREAAMKLLEASKKKEKKFHTTKEILKTIHEGRRF